MLSSEDNPEDTSIGTVAKFLSAMKSILREKISWKKPRRNIFGLAPGQMVRLKSAYIITLR